MEKIVELKNVSKAYKIGEKEFKALDNVNLAINKGELVVILGPSGAGKSTLLNLIGGMDSPSNGSILVDGVDISEYSETKLDIVKNYSDSKEALKDVGLIEHINKFPNQLSGGEQQRVSIARAIAKNPKLLLCDEPTGALDSKTGVEVLKLLKKQCDKNDGANTVIIVTHNALFADIADTVIRVKNGQIESVTKNENPKNIDEVKW